MHSPGGPASPRRQAELRRGVVGGELRPQAQAARRDGAEAPPVAVDDLKTSLHQRAGRRDFPRAHRPRVGVLDLRAVPASSWRMQRSRPSRMSTGSKPVTTIGTLYRPGDRPVLGGAHDRADVAGGQEALHLVVRRAEDRLHRRGHEHVGDEHGEVAQALAVGAEHGHGVGRGGGLKADGEEDDLRCGIAPGRERRRRAGSRRCARRRPAPWPSGGRCVVPGTRSMSPNEQRMTPGRSASSTAWSMSSTGVTQTGQPGPWTSVMPGGSSSSRPNFTIAWVWPPQISITVQGRVAARAMRGGQRLHRPRRRGIRRRTSWPRCRRLRLRAPVEVAHLAQVAKVVSASSWSTTLMARPTWTRT